MADERCSGRALPALQAVPASGATGAGIAGPESATTTVERRRSALLESVRNSTGSGCRRVAGASGGTASALEPGLRSGRRYRVGSTELPQGVRANTGLATTRGCRADQRDRVLTGVKARRCATPPLRGAAALTPAPRTVTGNLARQPENHFFKEGGGSPIDALNEPGAGSFRYADGFDSRHGSRHRGVPFHVATGVPFVLAISRHRQPRITGEMPTCAASGPNPTYPRHRRQDPDFLYISQLTPFRDRGRGRGGGQRVCPAADSSAGIAGCAPYGGDGRRGCRGGAASLLEVSEMRGTLASASRRPSSQTAIRPRPRAWRGRLRPILCAVLSGDGWAQGYTASGPSRPNLRTRTWVYSAQSLTNRSTAYPNI